MQEEKIATSKEENTPTVHYRQTASYDENGKIISSVLYRPYFENGSGFMLCYMSNIDSIVLKTKQPSILRTFLHIAAHQQFGNDGIFGYRCSKKHLQETLGIRRPALWSALKWLKENLVINEAYVDGVCEFMVNPNYITLGREKNKRVIEWIRRCAEYTRQLEAQRTEVPANDIDNQTDENS